MEIPQCKKHSLPTSIETDLNPLLVDLPRFQKDVEANHRGQSEGLLGRYWGTHWELRDNTLGTKKFKKSHSPSPPPPKSPSPKVKNLGLLGAGCITSFIEQNFYPNSAHHLLLHRTIPLLKRVNNYMYFSSFNLFFPGGEVGYILQIHVQVGSWGN